MKLSKRIGALALSCLLAFNLTGCTSKEDKVKVNLIAKLQQMYNKEFDVVDIDKFSRSSVSSDSDVYYGYAYLKQRDADDQYSTFYFETDPTCTNVKTQYYCMQMQTPLARYLRPKLNSKLQCDVITLVQTDQDYGFNDQMPLNQQTVLSYGIPFTVTIVVPTAGVSDFDTEANYYSELIKYLASISFKGSVYAVYCAPEYEPTLVQYYNHCLPLDTKLDSNYIYATIDLDFSTGASVDSVKQQLQQQFGGNAE